jgi:hypothetical protein
LNLCCSYMYQVRIYGSFWLPFLSMKWTNSSMYLTTLYYASSCWGAKTNTKSFNTE